MKPGRSILILGLAVTAYSGLALDAPFLQSRLFAPDAAPGDYFGSAIGMSGERAVIGTELGGAYVFLRREQWEFEQKLTPDLSFSYGARVSRLLIEGDRCLIAINDYIPTGTGRAIIYERQQDTWAMAGALVVPAGIRLEGDAAMDHDTIVLAAREHLPSTGPVTALIYNRQGTNWVLQQRVTPPLLPLTTRITTALDGNTLALGVQGQDQEQLTRSAVYLYGRQAGSWTSKQTLSLNERSYAFGFTLALDHERLVVGAPAFYNSPFLDGLILVYSFDGFSWREEQKLQVPGLSRPHLFGSVIALKGDRIVAGMPSEYSESAFLFERNGADPQRPWSGGLRLTGEDTNGWNGFGWSVAINENTLMIGSPRSGQPLRGHGGVYVFQRDEDSPVIASVSASPRVLTPPNHKMIPVEIKVNVSDNSGMTFCRIAEVTNSETGFRDKSSREEDVQITGDLDLLLRAERSGNGPGRVYTITIECRDAAGNPSTGSTTVLVPR